MKKEQLLNDIEKALRKWDEYSMIKLAGEKLTVSDINTLEVYAEFSDNQPLMKPRGAVAKVLDKYGYVHNW